MFWTEPKPSKKRLDQEVRGFYAPSEKDKNRILIFRFGEAARFYIAVTNEIPLEEDLCQT